MKLKDVHFGAKSFEVHVYDESSNSLKKAMQVFQKCFFCNRINLSFNSTVPWIFWYTLIYVSMTNQNISHFNSSLSLFGIRMRTRESFLTPQLPYTACHQCSMTSFSSSSHKSHTIAFCLLVHLQADSLRSGHERPCLLPFSMNCKVAAILTEDGHSVGRGSEALYYGFICT